ncbi:MAG: hypothetical protein RIC55_27465 [Pirellulaceae bacterium]
MVVVDNQRRPFDFSDDNFKPASKLGDLRDACLYATGRPEERADHAHSYSVEFDPRRLLAGTNSETVPEEGSVVSIHWLVQVGEEPDVKVDHQRESCRLRVNAGSLEPIDTCSREQLDENVAFEKRARFEKDYREFVLREIDSDDARRRRLAEAVRAGDVSQTLRVVAEDLCFWGGNLKQHMLHQISHLAKDPSFVRMRDVPEDAPFRVFETWIVRDWIGSREAFDLLEFHKSPEYAQSFSGRLERLHESRVAFAKVLTEYTVRTCGEDVEGIFALDEIRKDLKHQALWLAEHLDRIATQFDASRSSKDQSQTSTAEPSGKASPLRHGDSSDPQPFAGGEMVFHADRVELCGVDVCSGPRSSSRRIVLELLSQKRNDGTFVAYSGTELENQLKQRGGQGTAAGSIRDLRDDVMASLRSQAGLACGRKDVILSGGPGYRFAEAVNVHHVEQPEITDIADIDESDDVPNVPDDDVRDAFDVHDDATERAAWILQRLADGVRLKAPAVVEHFKCSVKTAHRDLTALKDEEKIEYVGAPRTGYYRLNNPAEGDQ